MAFEETTEYQLIQRLLESLRAIPEVQAALDEAASIRRVADRGYDARVDVRVSGRRLTLLIEAKKSLYPRDVRQALWELREGKGRGPEDDRQVDTVPMLIAESISPGSEELLQSERVADYAITDEAGAQRYAPFLSTVSQVRCRVVPGRATDEALGAIGARAVNEGANLTVIDTKSSGELLFREKVGGVWLASPVQGYLDLLQGEGRAKDMSEHLRRERLGF